MRTSGRTRSAEPETEMTEFDLERDLSINPHFLDAEFLNHPVLFMKYSKEAARANKEVKLAEERVKILRSKLILDANEDPKRCLGEGIKPTAPAVEAYYREHEDHKAAKKEFIEAAYYADLMNNAIFAFQARKSALENLVKLIGMEYSAAPTEPRNLPESMKAFEELKKGAAESAIRERGRRG